MTAERSTGRVAVITGASSGIGEATALAAAQAGAAVSLAARRTERIDALAQRIAEQGGRAIAIPTDVGEEEQARAFVERTHEELGRIDSLVNNAGVMLLGPFTADQRDDYRQMIEVNLLGAITATEVFLEQLRDGGGDIVNVSSVAGRTAPADFAVERRDHGG